MSTLYTHKCIKCDTKYNDIDPDPYYCDNCNTQRLQIIKDLDGKHNTIGQKPGGIKALEEEMMAKGGFISSPDGKNSKLFINVRDLGIIPE